MARIELRDCTIRIKDGLSGNAILAANGAGNGTTANIAGANAVLNTEDPALVPIGARFTIDNANGTLNHTTIHIVTARENDINGVHVTPTANFTFSPRWNGTAGTDSVPTVNCVFEFLPQAISIKIGEGTLTYTEHKDYKYMLDRGNLDVVREGDEKPVDVKSDFVYDFVTTGTGEDITPVDALKRQNGASEWVNASVDVCEPYAVDVEIVQHPPCSGEQDEVTLLPSFRYETLEFNMKDATIAVTGKCNVEQATVVRATHGSGDTAYPVV